MDFSNRDHTKAVWEQLENTWKDSKKPIGERFLGNNQLSQNSVEGIFDALADNFSSIGTFSIDKLNQRWGDRQDRNWVKIITFVLAEYAYYNTEEGSFWESLCKRLKLNYPQGMVTLQAVLNEGFDTLGLIKASGKHQHLSTLYLQSGIPSQNLEQFALLVNQLADGLGWWNIAYRYEAKDLAQSLYDHSNEDSHGLRCFLKYFCPIDNENVHPLSGEILKYLAKVALELERRNLLSKILTNDQDREKYLQVLHLPQHFFLRDWSNLVPVLTPKRSPKASSNSLIRQRRRQLNLRLDTLELNLQLVLPEQILWQKEWEASNGQDCQISEAQWSSTITYPASLEIRDLCVNLSELVDRWTWNLRGAENQVLLEWNCEGVSADFPLLAFDAETGDRLTLNSSTLKILGISELVCYFPTESQLQLDNAIAVTDPCFPCAIAGWQAQQIRLTGRSACFSLVSANSTISLQWQASGNQQPVLRGLQIKAKQLTYLEPPQIYYPLGDSIAIRIQIEDTDRQSTITAPDTQLIMRATGETWQQIDLKQWIKGVGNYTVKLWQGNWNWSTSFKIQAPYQVVAPLNLPNFQVQKKP